MSFHHAFVTGVRHDDDSIVLAIENAWQIATCADGETRWTPQSGELTFENVAKLLIQGRNTRRMTQMGDAGLFRRIATRDAGAAEFLVEWRRYAPRRVLARRYRIVGARRVWRAISSGRRGDDSRAARECLRQESAAYRTWENEIPSDRRFNDWEDQYADWPWLIRATRRHLDAVACTDWTLADIDLLLHALARNHRMEAVKRELIARPIHLLALAGRGLDHPDGHARWQLADALGTALPGHAGAHAITERYCDDADDYVRRRALIALGRRKSPRAEQLALRAWASGEEYQRMAAFEVLAAVESPMLADYCQHAAADARPYLARLGTRLRERAGQGSR